LVLIIAAVAGLGAWTDRPKVEVSDAPAVIHASRPWNAIIEISRRGRPLDGYKAFATLQGPRGTQIVKAKVLGHGRYRVRVRAPYGGFFTYNIIVGDRIAASGTFYSIPT
jgi:hypothetical protein